MFATLDTALILLKPVAVQTAGQNHFLDNNHHLGCGKDKTCFFSIASLKFITDFTHTTKREFRCTMLVILYARLLSWSASASATGLPLCRVAHRACKVASTQPMPPLLKVTQHFKQMRLILENLGRSFIKNERSSRRSIFSRFETVCRGDCCHGECFSEAVHP